MEAQKTGCIACIPGYRPKTGGVISGILRKPSIPVCEWTHCCTAVLYMYRYSMHPYEMDGLLKLPEMTPLPPFGACIRVFNLFNL